MRAGRIMVRKFDGPLGMLIPEGPLRFGRTTGPFLQDSPRPDFRLDTLARPVVASPPYPVPPSFSPRFDRLLTGILTGPGVRPRPISNFLSDYSAAQGFLSVY